MDSGFDDVLNGLADLPGITVEMCGDWLWITGRTEKVKKELKALGCRWSEKKNAWFYTAEKRRWYKKGKTLGQIRLRYGRKVLLDNEEEK